MFSVNPNEKVFSGWACPFASLRVATFRASLRSVLRTPTGPPGGSRKPYTPKVCPTYRPPSGAVLCYTFGMVPSRARSHLRGFVWGGVTDTIRLPSVSKFLREPPEGPRSGGEAMSEAKPVRWRPRRGHAQILDNQPIKNLIFIL